VATYESVGFVSFSALYESKMLTKRLLRSDTGSPGACLMFSYSALKLTKQTDSEVATRFLFGLDDERHESLKVYPPPRSLPSPPPHSHPLITPSSLTSLSLSL
jgi:hypothetical protein